MSFVSGLVKLHWNLKGKADTLLQLGDECAQLYNIDKPFRKYENAFKSCSAEVDGLDLKIVVLQDEISERIRKNTISGSDKLAKYAELKNLKMQKEQKFTNINKISKNWSTAVDNMKKKGPEKKKPGRKQTKDVQYLPSRDLKNQLGSITKRDVGKVVQICKEKQVKGIGILRKVDRDICKIEIQIEDSSEIDFCSDFYPAGLAEKLQNSPQTISIFKKHVKLSPYRRRITPIDGDLFDDEKDEVSDSETDADDYYEESLIDTPVSLNNDKEDVVMLNDNDNTDIYTGTTEPHEQTCSEELENINEPVKENEITDANVNRTTEITTSQNCSGEDSEMENEMNSSITLTVNPDGDELGIKELPLGECQFTILEKVSGSSACVGICLKATEDFICGTMLKSIKFDDKENIAVRYKNIVRDMVNYWNDYNLCPLEITTALKLPIFSTLKEEIEVNEVMWHTGLLHNDINYKACLQAYQAAITNCERQAILFFIPPDKAFVVLVDEEGSQLLLDSHIHYMSEQESFENAVKRKTARGRLVFVEKREQEEPALLRYIFGTLCATLRCNSTYGFLEVVKRAPKNL